MGRRLGAEHGLGRLSDLDRVPATLSPRDLTSDLSFGFFIWKIRQNDSLCFPGLPWRQQDTTCAKH
jgi:hypothetical protein